MPRPKPKVFVLELSSFQKNLLDEALLHYADKLTHQGQVDRLLLIRGLRSHVQEAKVVAPGAQT